MVVIRDILVGLIKTFFSLIAYFAHQTAAAGIDADPVVMGILVALLTLWLGSGFWAASIAGARQHSQKLSFLLGLLVPYLYPAAIVFAMDVKGAGTRERNRRKEEQAQQELAEEKRRVAEMLEDAPPDEIEAELPEEEVTWDMAYFERISRDEDGNPTGPWRIVYGDTEIVARRIIEAMPENVLVEVEGDSERGQRLRIPYSRIVSWEPA